MISDSGRTTGVSNDGRRGYLATVLLLVRHGETDANRAGLYLGRADPPLTDRGRTQADRLADRLPPAHVIVSSPLRRARETAARLGGRSGVGIVIDERWVELDYGPLDLRPVGSGVPPDVLDRWRDDPTFAPSGVETAASLSARVSAACDELVERAASSVVVVVSHVGPIKAAIGWALGSDMGLAGRLFVEDAGVSRIDVADGRPVVRWFNRVGEEPGRR
jgi:broad specificity phosphatase PhoE